MIELCPQICLIILRLHALLIIHGNLLIVHGFCNLASGQTLFTVARVSKRASKFVKIEITYVQGIPCGILIFYASAVCNRLSSSLS